MNQYAEIEKDQFSKSCHNASFTIFNDLKSQNEYFADDLIQRIIQKNQNNEILSIVLPTGPIDYVPLIRKINEQNIKLHNLFIFMMDEYCEDKNNLISRDHPMSFRGFIEKMFLEKVNPELRMPSNQLLFPDPSNLSMYTDTIENVGGIDIVYAGLGLTGHLAFNDPPENKHELKEENVKNSVTRVLELSRETIAQNALGGTRGLLEMVPPLAVTIGMKEILSAKEIHLYLLRKWHSGIFRKCLFGPMTPEVPGSYLQEHSNVKVHMPEYVSEKPIVVVTLDV